MPSYDFSIVPLADIPEPPYECPKDPLVLYAAAKSMESLCKSSNGMGLAAAQVGLPWNMFVFWGNYPKSPENFVCLVDCEYEPLSDAKSPSIEGCLSLPGDRYRVERYDEVKVVGKKLFELEDRVDLFDFESNFSGVMSVLVQHEIDHSFGREKMIDVIGKRIFKV